MTPQLLVTIGGSIYVAMGVGHALLTVSDVFRPRFFSPVDDRVRVKMDATGVRFAQARTSMWNGWLGFNISHGLGVAIFGAGAVFAAAYENGRLLAEPTALPIIVAVSMIYAVLAARFWFWAPLTGTIVNTALFLGAWLI